MNNYDQSSSGENIELHVQYDTDLARIYFEDFEREAVRINLGGRDNYLFLLGDSSAPFFTKSKLQRMKRADLLELCEMYEVGFFDDATKSEMIDELVHVSIKRHYEYLATDYSWNRIQENITHEYYVTRGYNQGDAALIVSINDPIDKSYIDHIFWDCPVYIRAEIDGVEFYEDSFLDDVYDYDKDEIKVKIQALPISDYAKGWLIDNLPDQPAYI